MAKLDKQGTVDRLRHRISRAKGVYLADFQGMNVAQATELRRRCRAAGVSFEVVKNTLARRAFPDELRTTLDPYLAGPTAVATSEADEITAAKIIADFVKEFERPALKAGVVDGRVIDRGQVKILAALPGKDALIGRMLGGLKSPVQKLHTALSSPVRGLALALKQVAEKKA
jgi:large subunit ribosomal protein L10